MAEFNAAPQDRLAINDSTLRLKDLDNLPLDEFFSALGPCYEEVERTNEEVLEDYFTHVETTHISTQDVEREAVDGQRPTLVIMAGPNGAGKTTIMTRLAKCGWLKGMVYQNQDFIAQNLFGGWNNDDAIKKSEVYCYDQRESCLREKKSIAFETVSGLSKLDFIRRAKAAGYHVIYLFVCTYSPTVHASRVAIRVMKGGHSIAIPTIISRYMESLLNSRALTRIADHAYIFDNSEHNKMAKLILEFKNGNLTKQYVDHLPRWAMTILEQ